VSTYKSLAEMQVLPTLPQYQVTQVTDEVAYEIVDALSNKREFPHPSIRVFSGLSAQYGLIYVAIPPTGNSLLLPIVTQNDAS
jgi:hypothetical protein